MVLGFYVKSEELFKLGSFQPFSTSDQLLARVGGNIGTRPDPGAALTWRFNQPSGSGK